MWLIALTMPDWGRLAEHPIQAVISALILCGAAVLGGLTLGFVASAIGLSSTGVTWARILGGIASAILAYGFLGSGDGFGWGPGPGGLPGRGPGNGDGTQVDTAPTAPRPPSVSTSPPPVSSEKTLYVRLLGGRTSPVFVEREKRFFAISSDSDAKALTIDEVMEHVVSLKSRGELRQVRVLVVKDSSGLGVPLIDDLRERVTKQARLPFLQPPPKDLLSETVITFPPEPSRY